MNDLICHDLWGKIKQFARKSSAKRAAVAYVTSEEFVLFGEGDILVTDASDGRIECGDTNAGILARAIKRGARVYSLKGLHAKVMVLGGTAVVGSANLSKNSHRMVEAAWVSDSPDAVGMCISLINQLMEQSDLINQEFLERILKIEVKSHPPFFGGGPTAKKVKIDRPRTWVVGVHPIEKEFPNEQVAIKAGMAAAKKKKTKKSSGTSWIRFIGKSGFRDDATEGDSIIQVWRVTGEKEPSTVYRHAPILIRQEEPKCTRFFVEEFQDEDETSISWSEFCDLVKRTQIRGRIGPSSSRVISPAQSEALKLLWPQ